MVSYAGRLTSLPEQTSRLEINEVRQALTFLPPEQCESLILVGASGFSYEEAAQICGMRGRHDLKVGCIARECDSRKFSPSTTPMISARTTRRAR